MKIKRKRLNKIEILVTYLTKGQCKEEKWESKFTEVMNPTTKRKLLKNILLSWTMPKYFC